jgi:hypothetical protein
LVAVAALCKYAAVLWERREGKREMSDTEIYIHISGKIRRYVCI